MPLLSVENVIITEGLKISFHAVFQPRKLNFSERKMCD